jgi:hypothetical protein
VCKKLIEKELTLDTLEGWYQEHRTDFYDGNEDPDLKKELDKIPDNVRLEVDVYQDEEDKRQQETFIHNSIAMQARLFLNSLYFCSLEEALPILSEATVHVHQVILLAQCIIVAGGHLCQACRCKQPVQTTLERVGECPGACNIIL